jgi:hypothetical protein
MIQKEDKDKVASWETAERDNQNKNNKAEESRMD